MIATIKSGSQWWIAALGCVLLPLAASRAEDTPTVAAQWRDYDVSFHYSSFYTYYNCDSLESKLEAMLRQLGAKKEVSVRTMGCWGSSNLGNMLTSRIKVTLPAEGDSAGTGFAAGYQPVKLRSHGMGEVGAGDCELLEQLRDQLLPKLNLSVVQDDIRCIPGQPTYTNRALQVRALVASDK